MASFVCLFLRSKEPVRQRQAKRRNHPHSTSNMLSTMRATPPASSFSSSSNPHQFNSVVTAEGSCHHPLGTFARNVVLLEENPSSEAARYLLRLAKEAAIVRDTEPNLCWIEFATAASLAHVHLPTAEAAAEFKLMLLRSFPRHCMFAPRITADARFPVALPGPIPFPRIMRMAERAVDGDPEMVASRTAGPINWMNTHVLIQSEFRFRKGTWVPPVVLMPSELSAVLLRRMLDMFTKKNSSEDQPSDATNVAVSRTPCGVLG